MPLDAWLLLFVAVGLGLTLELTFYMARRRDRRTHAGGATRGSAGPEEAP
jgi:hypothetical protein